MACVQLFRPLLGSYYLSIWPYGKEVEPQSNRGLSRALMLSSWNRVVEVSSSSHSSRTTVRDTRLDSPVSLSRQPFGFGRFYTSIEACSRAYWTVWCFKFIGTFHIIVFKLIIQTNIDRSIRSKFAFYSWKWCLFSRSNLTWWVHADLVGTNVGC